jgi:hypothetical protein
METLARTLADTLVVIHAAFVLFVVLGGLFALRWRWAMGLHLPAAIWGALIEFFCWECPLTPLENELRRKAAQAGYEGGFIDHYLLPILYPAGLGRETHVVIGLFVVILNGLIYWWVLRHSFRMAKAPALSGREPANGQSYSRVWGHDWGASVPPSTTDADFDRSRRGAREG